MAKKIKIRNISNLIGNPIPDFKINSMGRFVRKTKDEIGRPPDELFYRGEKKKLTKLSSGSLILILKT